MTWAFQWDMQIAAGEDFLISKVKRVDVPEPSTLSVLALGLAVDLTTDQCCHSSIRWLGPRLRGSTGRGGGVLG